MNKHIVLVILFISGIISGVKAQDKTIQVLKEELNRNFTILKNEPIPAYYISVRLDEYQSLGAVGRLGRIQSEAILNSPTRVLSSSMRVGDYSLDNSHEIRGGYGGASGVEAAAQYLPYEDSDQLLKTYLWSQLDQLYKSDVQIYEQVKANIAVMVEKEDKSADFSKENVENYYENPLTWESLEVNPKELEEKVRLYSAVFDKNNDILDGYAYMNVSLSRKTFIDTEGRTIAENTVTYHLGLSADAWAEDGMYLPLQKTWIGFTKGELPSDEEVIRTAEEMSKMLSALKQAPVVESFTGPAILSPQAAGVFFHEIFGHRVEGSRLKQEHDAQTFKKKIGEKVLPSHMNVSFDPTLTHFEKTPLNGYYVFDDEGIRGQKVEVVKKGVLRDFIMSRTPIEGFEHSNGHGRAQTGLTPISRQSNLIIESTQKLKEEELLKRLRKEAKSQGKEYAYYFKEVSGGFTNTNRYSPNSFNVTPLVVYRIYTDGRPDELVRGVDMVGTPLAMFSQIDACGEEYAVFNGSCGAESGSIPVSCVSPALLVKQIETQKKAKGQTQPPILSKPEEDNKLTGRNTEDIISQAIKKEVDRNLAGLRMESLQAPFFISYTIGDIKSLSVSASHGSLTSSDINHYRGANARLLIGDYTCSDENYNGTPRSAGSFDGSPTLDNDEKGIRYTVWRDLDAIYKRAAETYEQKMSTIKQLNIPEKDLELPDWDKTPVVVMNDLPRQKVNLEKGIYEQYVKEASSVFKEYAEVLDSEVSVLIYDALIYFYNTEGTEFRFPLTFTTLALSNYGQNKDGEYFSYSTGHTFATPDGLPSIEEVKKEAHKVAQYLMEEIHAPKLEESYSGPVLFEGVSVVSTMYANLVYGENIHLNAIRKPLSASGFSAGGNSLEDMMDKRIVAREITIEDLTGTKEYKGEKLLGYAPVDGQGVVPPERLVLVEDGVLKTLLSDRVPTPKVPHSNGHALLGYSLGNGISPGVIRISDTRKMEENKLKQELLASAEAEGYEYAYIVRETSGDGSYPILLYRVNIADGSETRVRSAFINNLDDKSFRNVIGVSDQEQVYHTVSGSPISIITPRAILFEELRIQSDRVDDFRMPPKVPRN